MRSHARLGLLAETDDVADAALERLAAGLEQRAEDGGVQERGGREVHDDAGRRDRAGPPVPSASLEAVAQRRRGVDVVLAANDDDQHVPVAVVEGDGPSVHSARARYPGTASPNVPPA